MRKVILGDLRHNEKLMDKINQAFSEVQDRIEEKEGLSLADDLVFFSQLKTDWPVGLEYGRNRGYIEFVVSCENEPDIKVLRAGILKAVVEQIIQQKRSDDFDSKFLFDLYRLGVGTYYANLFGVVWEAEISEENWMGLIKQAKSDIKHTQDSGYDEEFWFEGSDDRPDFAIWFVGERVLRKFSKKSLRDLLKIEEKELLGLFSKS